MIAQLVLYAMLMSSMLGYTSKGNELIGQVKLVQHNTPIICPEYDSVDVSLGVIMNGTGSISRHDMHLFIQNQADAILLRTVSKSGELVKIEYNERRLAICRDDYEVTKVTTLESHRVIYD